MFEKKTITKQFNNYIIIIGPNLASNVQSYKGIPQEKLLKYEEPVLEIKEITDDELHEAFWI